VVDVRGVRAAPPETAERFEDHGGLADAPRSRGEDVVAVLEPLHETSQVGLAAHQVGGRDRPADGKVRRDRRSLAKGGHGAMILRMYQRGTRDE